MGLGWQHILIFGVIVLLLFGRGKISELMGDVAKGIKAFKKGMTEDEKTTSTEPAKTEPVKTIDHQPDAKTASDLKARAETEKRFEGSTS
jgi:sec-independent protein translocase protein TatA